MLFFCYFHFHAYVRTPRQRKKSQIGRFLVEELIIITYFENLNIDRQKIIIIITVIILSRCWNVINCLYYFCYEIY